MSNSPGWNALQKLFLSIWAMVTLVLIFVVILLIREIAMHDRDPLGAFQVTEETPAAAPPSTRTSSLGPKEVQLFFAAPDGRSLVPEKRLLPAFSESTVVNCRAALDELIKGPQSDARPILPGTVTVKAVFLLATGELVVDFSRELQSEHTTFDSATLESLMVQGVVQTLSQASMQNPRDPNVRRVRFLIEDTAPTEAFPSHIDLSEAVAPDSQWLTAQR